MARFNIGDTVTLTQDAWGKPNPPVGTIVNKFHFESILHGELACTESQFQVAVCDSGRCYFGYDVKWSHNDCVNPWSELELETVDSTVETETNLKLHA